MNDEDTKGTGVDSDGVFYDYQCLLEVYYLTNDEGGIIV